MTENEAIFKIAILKDTVSNLEMLKDNGFSTIDEAIFIYTRSIKLLKQGLK